MVEVGYRLSQAAREQQQHQKVLVQHVAEKGIGQSHGRCCLKSRHQHRNRDIKRMLISLSPHFL